MVVKMASVGLNKKIKSKYSFVKAWVRAIHFHVSFKSETGVRPG